MSKHLEDNNLIARWMDDRLSDEEKEQLKASGELDALKTVIDDIDTWKVKPFNADAGLSRNLQIKIGWVLPQVWPYYLHIASFGILCLLGQLPSQPKLQKIKQ